LLLLVAVLDKVVEVWLVAVVVLVDTEVERFLLLGLLWL
jgi:hypothetical protein